LTSKAVETEQLTKRYGENVALDGLTLEVQKGELFGLLGPNGAGKSTAIEILTGQTDPTSGTAHVMGIDPMEEPVKARSHMGVLPEREDPPSFLTPREYFEYVADVREFELDCRGHLHRDREFDGGDEPHDQRRSSDR